MYKRSAPNLPAVDDDDSTVRPPSRTDGPGSRVPGGPGRPPHHVHPWRSALGHDSTPGLPTSTRIDRHRSSPLSSLSSPAPPVRTRRGRHCLAAAPLGSRRLLLAARSPSVACSRPTRRAAGYRPAGHRGSQVSSDLRPEDHVARGCYPPGLARHVPPSRAATISGTRTFRFRGPERGSCSPTTPRGCFAVRPHVFRGSHWQRLGGAFVVELFAFPLFASRDTRPRSTAGPSGRPDRCSPRQRGCAGADRDMNPDSLLGFRPRPPGGIRTRFVSERPGCRAAAGRVLVAPCSVKGHSSGSNRSVVRLPCNGSRVCRPEPPSHRASRSPGDPALRAGVHNGGW